MFKLSIITCTFNSQKYLKDCIKSFADQNLPIDLYEHIFVDAFSNDDTLNIIKKYQNKFNNVKLIQRHPKGVYNAMNEGIKYSNGEYIICLNSDDFLVSGVLGNYLKYIEETGNKSLYYGIINNYNDGKFSYGSTRMFPLKKWLFYNFGTNVLIFHPTVLVKRADIIKIGLFNEDKKIASDYGMRLKFIKEGKSCIFYPHYVSNFRVHSNSLSCSNEDLGKNEVSFYRKKYLSPLKYYIGEIIDRLLVIYGNIYRTLKK